MKITRIALRVVRHLLCLYLYKKKMIRFAQFALLLLPLACANKPQLLQEVCRLPKDLSEVSAVQVAAKSDWIWTLQDSGNAAELYAIDKSGNLKNTLKITNAPNIDWEDLATDPRGNLYIGDFGNNANKRQDLSIYKVAQSDLGKTSAAVSTEIGFYLPEQTEFPPKKSGRIYDIESFFYYNDHFYLFTKNRSSKFNGTTALYEVPNKEGRHAAKLISTFDTCDAYNHCAVTSADISPDGKKVILLGSSYVWIFTGFSGNNFFSGQSEQIDLQSFTQKEGVCFTDNNTLLITDEREKKNGGYLYELDLSKLKSKP